MCGIVGYVGREAAAPILLEGLSRLEYRGYDSAGVAVCTADGLSVHKAKGRLHVLSGMLDGGRAVQGTAGVGHTLGHPRRALRRQLPSPGQPQRQDCRGT